MTKPTTDTSPTNMASTAPADRTALDSNTIPSFWLLKDGTAPKLGARAESGIRYQVLADADRQQLYIAITGNESGGYFSRERVSFNKIETCLGTIQPDKAFPSKTFKDAFTGRSSNNAGFLVAVLRKEGLLAAAPDSETQHVRHGDMATWKKAMFTEKGTLIAPAAKKTGEKQSDGVVLPDHKEHKKPLGIPLKKS
ncbi:hypothetical protein [Rugamonas apoptosis]|uniref:Uncharacterized protein n=1 Tax=Rugamonas apoptosis TaxID=2758570 RepID=A0A7W2IJ38_9BURK|nr:hypothetical protein [Rugamonas apoptosis]MBA5685922.1 hypothetical protein [Rugamonas apoptosis]